MLLSFAYLAFAALLRLLAAGKRDPFAEKSNCSRCATNSRCSAAKRPGRGCDPPIGPSSQR